MSSAPTNQKKRVFLPCARSLSCFLFLAGSIGVFSNTADAQNSTPAAGSDLPILGIAQVTNKVSDLDKARAYYGGVLGFLEAFDLKDAAGKVTSAYFKVNDDQYIELTPNLRPG